MRDYELLCILPGTLAEDEVQPVVAAVTTIITEQNGQDLRHDDLGKSRLAYPMKHIRYGYFHVFYFSAEPEAIVVLEKKLLLDERVLRVVTRIYSKDLRARKLRAMQEMRLADSEALRSGRVDSRERERVAVGSTFAPGIGAQSEQKEVKTEAGHVDIAEIDKKLDEILESPLENV